MSSNSFYQYHYDFLSQNEKSAYELFLNELKMRKTVIDLSSLTIRDYSKVILSIKLDHPELYYVNFNDTFNGEQTTANLSVDYFLDVDENKIQEIVEVVQKEVQQLDEYDKMVYIHDFVVKNCFAATPEYNNHDFDLFGALVLHRSLCEGASKAFMYLASQCGLWVTILPCMIGKINHAINLVKINDKNLYLDIGNDLKRKSLFYKHLGKVCYPHFNHGIGLTLKMLEERRISLDKQYQIDVEEEYNYLIKNHLLFHTLEDARLFFARSIQRHRYLTISYDGSFSHDKFVAVVRDLLNRYFNDVKIINLVNKTICVCGGDLYEG